MARTARDAGRDTGRRLRGVDAARGVALLGMMSVHVMPAVGDDGGTTTAHLLMSGRAAALFAVLAGVGLALATGGTRPPSGLELKAARRALVARAGIVAFVGCTLGLVETPAAIILVYYGVFFVVVLPFLGLRLRVLVVLAVGAAVVVPVLSHLARQVLDPPTRTNPTFDALEHPGRLLSELTLTGYYPALPWLAYLLTGLAVGRLVLRSSRVAVGLVGVGLALAVGAKALSWLLLHPLGGLDRLATAVPPGSSVETYGLDRSLEIGLFGTTPTTSWWWLGVSAPHASTALDLAHTTGTSLAVLGVALLVSRVVRLPLPPLAAAGSMTLTLYSLHVVALGQGWGPDDPTTLLVVHAAIALVVASLWRPLVGRGPLEALAAAADRSARAKVTAAHDSSQDV
ncbi:MAG: heparan-alpha-glucosaminide N-acetyltransferase domain-containing protein [Actinomycetes bacterium]